MNNALAEEIESLLSSRMRHVDGFACPSMLRWALALYARNNTLLAMYGGQPVAFYHCCTADYFTLTEDDVDILACSMVPMPRVRYLESLLGQNREIPDLGTYHRHHEPHRSRSGCRHTHRYGATGSIPSSSAGFFTEIRAPSAQGSSYANMATHPCCRNYARPSQPSTDSSTRYHTETRVPGGGRSSPSGGHRPRSYRTRTQAPHSSTTSCEADTMEGQLKRPWGYYAVLGVDRDASAADITAAYRRLAMTHHPDRHSGAGEQTRLEAQRRFQALGEAYEWLRDAEKRELCRLRNGVVPDA